jgi:hypothetical protein
LRSKQQRINAFQDAPKKFLPNFCCLKVMEDCVGLVSFVHRNGLFLEILKNPEILHEPIIETFDKAILKEVDRLLLIFVVSRSVLDTQCDCSIDSVALILDTADGQSGASVFLLFPHAKFPCVFPLMDMQRRFPGVRWLWAGGISFV